MSADSISCYRLVQSNAGTVAAAACAALNIFERLALFHFYSDALWAVCPVLCRCFLLLREEVNFIGPICNAPMQSQPPLQTCDLHVI